MAKLSQKDRDSLQKNPNILKVTGSNVTYTSDFKTKAVKLLKDGWSAEEIFLQAGIDVSLFGSKYAFKSIHRWEQLLQKHGASALKKERRGMNATGRPAGRKFKSLEEEVAYLRAEVDFLKKLRALEDEEQVKPKSSKSSTRR